MRDRYAADKCSSAPLKQVAPKEWAYSTTSFPTRTRGGKYWPGRCTLASAAVQCSGSGGFRLRKLVATTEEPAYCRVCRSRSKQADDCRAPHTCEVVGLGEVHILLKSCCSSWSWCEKVAGAIIVRQHVRSEWRLSAFYLAIAPISAPTRSSGGPRRVPLAYISSIWSTLVVITRLPQPLHSEVGIMQRIDCPHPAKALMTSTQLCGLKL